MSKYYKAEDVINAIEDKIAEYIPTLYGRYAEIPLELRMAIEHLPTIEVSEDMVSRKDFEDVIRRMGERNCFTCGVYHEGEWTLMGRNPEKVTAEELEESDRAVSLAEVCKIIQETYEVCPATWGRLRNLPSVVPTIEQSSTVGEWKWKSEDVDLVCIKNFANGDVLNAIRSLPTIEVSEDYEDSTERKPREGEWLGNENGTYTCSKCQSWLSKEQHSYARYCLHCGSKMRG